VVSVECSVFRLCFCVILKFICENSVRCEETLQGIYTMLLCVCDIYLRGQCPWRGQNAGYLNSVCV
jgi:hypothetical protein